MALTPSQEIDKFINDLTDWRGTWIKKFRAMILKTAPEVSEGWKWGVPVWTLKGNVVASGVFKDHVKLNFFKGASLPDPKKLFNAGLEAKATRAIDIAEKPISITSKPKRVRHPMISVNWLQKKD